MRTFLLLFLIAACLPAAAQPSRVAVRTSPALGHTALLVRPAAEASTLRLQVYRHDGTLRFETTLPHHPDDPLPHLAGRQDLDVRAIGVEGGAGLSE